MANYVPCWRSSAKPISAFAVSGRWWSPDDADELAAFHAMLVAAKSETPEMGATSLLSPRDARTLFPPLRSDLAGLHVANGARVDGRRMAAGLLRAAQGLGARQVEGQAG